MEVEFGFRDCCGMALRLRFVQRGLTRGLGALAIGLGRIGAELVQQLDQHLCRSEPGLQRPRGQRQRRNGIEGAHRQIDAPTAIGDGKPCDLGRTAIALGEEEGGLGEGLGIARRELGFAGAQGSPAGIELPSRR